VIKDCCKYLAVNLSQDYTFRLLIEIEEWIWIGKKVALTAKAVRIVGIAIIF
jgi:hypothetical protein